MNQLESSWVLEERLKNIKCSSDLKEEIEAYILKEHDSCTGKSMSLDNIYYRANLHCIEDNIDKDGLVDELRSYNLNF